MSAVPEAPPASVLMGANDQCRVSFGRHIMWTRRRLLIWGKTYPEFSKRYYETVCTGAIDAETRRLVRIYPISLRYNDEQFAKYQWIEADIQKTPTDFRPESFKINQNTIKLGGKVDTTEGWRERSEWVLNDANLFRSMDALREAEASDHTSLGVIKPREIINFTVRRKTDEERREWEEQREHALQQRELFVDIDSKTKDLRFMPIQYRVHFRCFDEHCAGHDCSILDWEIYQLSRKMYATTGGSNVTTSDKVIDALNTRAHPERVDAHGG